ncbi:hypothetical protein TrLO_g6461 [Triparma laevis f. longispina]|uniref:DNA topoisomerase n=1 Tax=Triparma laevis f. longispina TaxID=1714387 RepID=A0A9W7CM95_9STRA|nr:hypothetical protein TrLO_g6461 [Triparma laevis f. longispina]
MIFLLVCVLRLSTNLAFLGPPSIPKLQRLVTEASNDGPFYPYSQGRHPSIISKSFPSIISTSTTTSLSSTPTSSDKTTSSSLKPHLNSTLKSLVIVESPSKASTIQKILSSIFPTTGSGSWTVQSCNGHVLDLPKSSSSIPKKYRNETWSRLGINVDKSYEPIYVIPDSKTTLVSSLLSHCSKSDIIYLATDSDREGEAISSHLKFLIREKGLRMECVRVTFNEITGKAVGEGFERGREVDMDLVRAQETRRIVDRLTGFTVSPVLWKKIAPGLSAGRVQSVGLGRIVERERERMEFKSVEWYDYQANFTLGGEVFRGDLIEVDSKKISKSADFTDAGTLKLGSSSSLHIQEATLPPLTASLSSHPTGTITSLTSKTSSLSPPNPFITSSLQITSNRRLGLTSTQTMRSAQKLYESGYITYMRTDSFRMSEEGTKATSEIIEKIYGQENVKTVDVKKSKSKKDTPKNAQEAHEAIRPSILESGTFASPSSLTSSLSKVDLALYTLIYSRTLASMMIDKVVKSTTCLIDVGERNPFRFKVTGSQVVNKGWAVVDNSGSNTSSILPSELEKDEIVALTSFEPNQHKTQPPPRFNEATFVKELERLGVGRPSTYASVLETLRTRAYVTSGKEDEFNNDIGEARGTMISAQRAAGSPSLGGGRGSLIPSLTAFVVSDLLKNWMSEYVDSEFTRDMEERLDSIAKGEGEKNIYLKEYFEGERGLKELVKKMDEECKADDARRANLPLLAEPVEAVAGGNVSLFVGPWGPYVVRSNGEGERETAPLPGGMITDLENLTPSALHSIVDGRNNNGTILGKTPEGDNVRLCLGRFGSYLQVGEKGENGTRTQTLPKQYGGMGGSQLMNVVDSGNSENKPLNELVGLTFERAMGYLNLPRTICEYEEKKVETNIGRYGPYIKFNNSFVSLPVEHDLLEVGEEIAIGLVIDGIINKSAKLGRGVLLDFGKVEGGTLTVREGRFGVYLNWKKVNAKLPKEYADEPTSISQEVAWAAIQEKAAGGTGKKAAGKKKVVKGNAGKEASNSSNLPSPPKRPPSAYLLFCGENRAEVSKTTKKLGDVSKELARLWKESEGKRERWEEQAADAKKKYEADKNEWAKECEKLEPGGLKKVNKKKVEAKATRTPSAYMIFCSEIRSRVMEMENVDGEKLR